MSNPHEARIKSFRNSRSMEIETTKHAQGHRKQEKDLMGIEEYEHFQNTLQGNGCQMWAAVIAADDTARATLGKAPRRI